MIDMRINKLVLILSIFFLMGCSTPRESFDCKYGKGVSCRSISEINEMVNNREHGRQNANTSPVAGKVVDNHSPTLSQEITSLDDTIVQRVTEEHLRVWLAPFQDEQGNFHEASIVHAVLRPGFWQW